MIARQRRPIPVSVVFARVTERPWKVALWRRARPPGARTFHIAELNAGNLPILSKELGAPTERPRRLRQTFLVACVWEAGVRESY